MSNILNIEIADTPGSIIPNGLSKEAKMSIKNISFNFAVDSFRDTLMSTLDAAYKAKEEGKTGVSHEFSVNLNNLLRKIMSSMDVFYHGRDLTIDELVDLGIHISINTNVVRNSMDYAEHFIPILISEAISSNLDRTLVENGILNTFSRHMEQYKAKQN